MSRPAGSYRGARRNAERKMCLLAAWRKGPHYTITSRKQVIHHTYVDAMKGKPV